MQKRKILSVLTMVLMLSAASFVSAAAPKLINFQGVLTDSDGKAVTGAKSIVFKIYDVATAGTALLTDTQSVTVESNGVYSVQINAAALAFDVQYWLGVNVAGDGEMSPRYKLGSSAYAINASDAEKLDGQGSSYYLDYNNFTNLPAASAANIQVYDGGVEVTSPTARIVFDGTQFAITEPTASTAAVAIAASGIDSTEIAAGAIQDSEMDYTAVTLADFTDDVGYVERDGSVAMTGALNMDSHLINNVTDPSSAQDAATKNYVDTNTGGGNAAVLHSTQTYTGGNIYTQPSTFTHITASNDINIGDDLVVTDDVTVGGDVATTGSLTAASASIPSIAAGGGTASAGATGIALGTNSKAPVGIAIGHGASSGGSGGALALGNDAFAGTDATVAIGYKSSATALGSLAISDYAGGAYEVSAANKFGAEFSAGYDFTGGTVTISNDLNVGGNLGATSNLTVGGNLSVTGAMDMTSGLISNVSDPVSAQDAATMQYVLDNTGQGNAAVLKATQTYTGGNIFTQPSTFTHITASNDVSVGDDLIVADNVVVGAAVIASGALSGTTLNTGNGSYELFAMDQDVQIADSPTFAGVTIGSATVSGDVAVTGSLELHGGTVVGTDSHSLGNASSVTGNNSSVLGGQNNIVSNNLSVIAGGQNNVVNEAGAFIGGGDGNHAVGMFSTIPGGYYNSATDMYTFAAGRKSSATAQGSWAISDSENADNVNTVVDSFKARFAGGYDFDGGPAVFEGNVELAAGTTRYYGIAAHDFVQWNTSGHTADIDQIGYGYSLVFISSGNACSVLLTAPVNLPQGAVVTEVTAYLYDNDATGNDVVDCDVSFRYSAFDSNSSTALAEVLNQTTSGASTTATAITDSTVTNHSVDNETNTYTLFAKLQTDEAGSSIGITGVKIKYFSKSLGY